jgi:TRAP-type C4-dicarboxylate transport system permease small subunit
MVLAACIGVVVLLLIVVLVIVFDADLIWASATSVVMTVILAVLAAIFGAGSPLDPIAAVRPQISVAVQLAAFLILLAVAAYIIWRVLASTRAKRMPKRATDATSADPR